MIKEFIRNNINGVLGTVIFHLLLLIAFLFLQIKEIRKEHKEYIVIDFQDSPPPEIKKKKIDLNQLIPGLNEEQRRNIAVNTANKFEKEISTDDYLKQLKEQYDIENMDEAEKKALEEKYSIKKKETGKKEQQGNPDLKENETNISFTLEKRYVMIPDNPVYLCVGSAVIVLDITVDTKGHVVNASVNNSASRSDDPCFIEQAIESAKKWKFNADFNAPPRQKGTMTFKFVAQ